MDQEAGDCIVETAGYIEVFVNDNGIEETVVYTDLEKLADGFGVDVAELEKVVGVAACTGYCKTRKTKNKNGTTTVNCTDKCDVPCACHVIEITKDAEGNIVETDKGVPPFTYTPKKGTAYTCRCV